MKCPFCGHSDDRVLDTRVQKDDSIRRRRECLSCKSRFSTLETLVVNYPYVIKKDGRREPFSKEKILKGLRAACQKRPIALSKIEELVERISLWVLNRSEGEIPALLIGRKLMVELKSLDDVAYVRFSSVYRQFKDVQEFVDSLEEDELLNFNESKDSVQLPLTPILEINGEFNK